MKKMSVNKQKKTLGRYLSCLLVLTLCLCITACGSMWDYMWDRTDDTSVDSNLLVIPGSGGPEDTMMFFEGAVNYTGEAHEGTDIDYIGNGERRNRIIVIDPGHQAEANAAQEPLGPGSDMTQDKVTAGVSGSHSGAEHAVNLEVALLLRDELIKRGYSVVMIRETADVNISNMERAQIANKYHAAAFVRIHANTSEDTSVKGALAVCQSPEKPYPDCAAMYEVSHLLSERVLSGYCKATGMEELNVREVDDMTAINWSEVPTTILQMGYLSNENEDMLMAVKFFKQQAAEGIADGIDTFMDIIEIREQNQVPGGDPTTGKDTSAEVEDAQTQAVAADGDVETETLVTVESTAVTMDPTPQVTEADVDTMAGEEAEVTEKITEAQTTTIQKEGQETDAPTEDIT